MSGDRQDTLSTYRHLRLAMALVLGMLLVAVGLRAASKGLCWEGSISAYYFTSARAVFVAALCVLGTCLIVYRGNTDTEDIALNGSGALAFVVAFVPTGAPDPMNPVKCSASNIPNQKELADAVNNNIVAMIIVSFVALAVAIVLLRRSTTVGKAAFQALFAFLGILGVGTLVFALWPEGFRDKAHTIAAIGLFIGILAVVGLNARGAEQAREREGLPVRYRNAYRIIAWAMGAAAVLTFGAAQIHTRVKDSEWEHSTLVIEAALLALFLVFWLVQTAELWHQTRRGSPAVESPA